MKSISSKRWHVAVAGLRRGLSIAVKDPNCVKELLIRLFSGDKLMGATSALPLEEQLLEIVAMI